MLNMVLQSLKITLLVVTSLSLFSPHSFAQDNPSNTVNREKIRELLPQMIENFEALAKTDTNQHKFWEGTQEIHPVWDLITLATIEKVDPDRDTRALRQEIIKRTWKWQNEESQNWPLIPDSRDDAATTVATLICLKKLYNIQENHHRVKKAWDHIKQQGHSKQKHSYEQLNFVYRIFLVSLGYLDRKALPPFPPKLLGLPEGVPANIRKMGLYRSLFIPLIVWDFYHNPQKNNESYTFISEERIKSAGDQFGTMTVDNKGFTLATAGLGIVLNRFGDTWEKFINKVADFPDSYTADYWAQEGLGYLLSRQHKQGSWYSICNSVLSLLALHAVEMRNIDAASGVVLTQKIQSGVDGILAWREIGSDPNNPEKDKFFPAARSSVWDTSLAMQSLQSAQKRGFAVDQELQSDVVDWLMDAATTVRGDWAFQKKNDPREKDFKKRSFDPNPNGRGQKAIKAWAFAAEEKHFPDTDDTASTMEVLIHSNRASEPAIQESVLRGTEWLLAHQNKDGGFPAWEREISKISFLFIKKLLHKVPDVNDFSQADVTSRILRYLVSLKKENKAEHQHLKLDKAIIKACQFLKSREARPGNVDGKSSMKLWVGDWIVNYSYAAAEVIDGLMKAAAVVQAPRTGKERGENPCWSQKESESYLLWLQHLQAADGGWNEDYISYTKGKYVARPGKSGVVQSTFILKAFLTYEKQYQAAHNGSSSQFRESLDKGINFILSKIGENAFITERLFTAVYIKEMMFSEYTLMPHYKSIDVLSEYLSLNPRN